MKSQELKHSTLTFSKGLPSKNLAAPRGGWGGGLCLGTGALEVSRGLDAIQGKEVSLATLGAGPPLPVGANRHHHTERCSVEKKLT